MKNGRLSDDFIDLTTKLMLAHERSEIMRIASAFNSTIEKLIQAENHSDPAIKQKATTCTLKFTKEEISKIKMATTFKKEFIANGLVAHITKRESGKRTFCYEIRYRSNGYKIEASSTDLAEAKRKFLAKTVPGEIEKYYVGRKSINEFYIPTTFSSYGLYYLQNFQKERVSEAHYKNCVSTFHRYLANTFKEKPIKNILPSEVKKILTDLQAQGKGRTADDVYSILNGIFKCATAQKLVDISPMAMITYVQHEREKGVALTPEEEQNFIKAIKGSDCEIQFALALFCGLRPNEYKTAEIHGDFIKAVNSKRKNGKIEYKYIPICNGLRPYLKNGITQKYGYRAILRRFHEIFPNHTLKDIRTTFYTRCQTFGVAEPALKEFMGHSFGALGNAYSDLTKFSDYLLDEGSKLNQWEI